MPREYLQVQEILISNDNTSLQKPVFILISLAISTPNLLGSPTQWFGEQCKAREQLLISAAVEIPLSGRLHSVPFKVLGDSGVLSWAR